MGAVPVDLPCYMLCSLHRLCGHRASDDHVPFSLNEAQMPTVAINLHDCT